MCEGQAFEQYKHRKSQRFTHVTLGKFVLILGFHHPLHFKNSGNIYLTDLLKEEVEETLQCPISVAVKKQYFCR